MVGKDILKIVRTADNGERVTGLFNFSNHIQEINADIHAGRELIAGEDIRGTTLTLDPWQVMWIKEN